ncbi:MAG: clan AA aspartic protease [Candidatus Omnitrophica bacterium]|nr:clan AA aspartic protease [Candidatus Omnitrophota bacterium]
MRAIVLSLSMLLLTGPLATCDMIYFKDGGKIEGIIQEETEENVVIDLGIGTMTVSPDEIDSIERGTSKEIEDLRMKKVEYQIERGEWAPPGMENIKILYSTAQSDRSSLNSVNKSKTSLEGEIASSENYMSKLLETREAKGKELNLIDSKEDVERYNAVVTKINSINAELSKSNKMLENLKKDKIAIDDRYAKIANRYRMSFQRFISSYKQAKESADAKDEEFFLDVIGSAAAKMEADFEKDVTSYTASGNQIIVDAVVNGSTQVRLVVDTGASIVLLTAEVADSLGINMAPGLGEIKIIMADGTEAIATPILLDSVKVGKAEVKGVQAALIDRESIGGVDGLLGMSFLNNFIIQVDNNSKKLILERVL